MIHFQKKNPNVQLSCQIRAHIYLKRYKKICRKKLRAVQTLKRKKREKIQKI